MSLCRGFNGTQAAAEPTTTTTRPGVVLNHVNVPTSSTTAELDKIKSLGVDGTPTVSDLEDVEGSVSVCIGKRCCKRGSMEVLKQLCRQSPGFPKLDIQPCKCMNLCEIGPNLELKPKAQSGGAKVVNGVTPSDLQQLLRDNFCGLDS